jgi:hypothetical protein
MEKQFKHLKTFEQFGGVITEPNIETTPVTDLTNEDLSVLGKLKTFLGSKKPIFTEIANVEVGQDDDNIASYLADIFGQLAARKPWWEVSKKTASIENKLEMLKKAKVDFDQYGAIGFVTWDLNSKSYNYIPFKSVKWEASSAAPEGSHKL